MQSYYERTNKEGRAIVEPTEHNNHQIAQADSAVSASSKDEYILSSNIRDSADPMIGYLLDGRYELLEAIGSGGMGVVYKARLNNVGKMVAIKTLNIQVQTKDNVRERFHREIDLLLKLEHPHIVAVQDCLYGPNSQPYVIMDLLRGVTLEQELEKSGPLPPERVRKILIQVCAALKYAHQHRVVHRDLKPGNIMLLENEVDFVKVLDFGLAMIGENSHKITQSGEFWGSPAYASPEQIKGDDTDHRTDIYSLGCVMYELLCGKDPFHGEGLYDLLRKQVNAQPAPLSVTNSEITIPAEMEKIVFKCLEKKPQERFQTVAELQAALESMSFGWNTVQSSEKQDSGINRLGNDQVFASETLPAEAKSYRTKFVLGSVLALVLLFAFAFLYSNNLQKSHVTNNSAESPKSNSIVIDRKPPSIPTKTRSANITLAPSKNAEYVIPPVKRAVLRKPNQDRRVEQINKNKQFSRNRPSGTTGSAERAAKPNESPSGDPFARLREHLSTGARNE
ncbi:MAG: serine/threonine protein kinase [Leptolyngbya sp.]|nr:serine/threonine protein kinase [Candidatus Melainabacteria bacterium]